MTALEVAKLYMAVMRTWKYTKKQIEDKVYWFKRLETKSFRRSHEQFVPAARAGLKRNRRRLRQVLKLKSALEAALRVKAKIGKRDVDALWPSFMDREGKINPLWKVEVK